MREFDTVIIGFGKGGKTAAGFLAKQGERVALIEKSNTMYGGTCINVGCIPSKSLVTWSERAAGSAAGADKEAYFKAAMERKHGLVGKLRDKNFHMLDDLDAVTVIHGAASFVDDHRVAVASADGTEVVYGKRIIINTGSRPRIPNTPGLTVGQRIVTSEGLLSLSELPRHLVIVGGGYIGLEFASMFASFGSRVTILEQGNTFIKREDRDVAAAVAEALSSQGVEIALGATVTYYDEGDNGVTISYEQNGVSSSITGDVVLVAVGRIPNTEGLHLELAGVETDDRGAVVVNELRQTSKPHIYAFGDVVGGLQFTYISLDDFRIFRDAYLQRNVRTPQERVVPYSVFISPALSRVGYTEAEATAKGLDFQVVSMPVASIPKANVLQRTTGLYKALVENKTGRILGAAIFGEESYEVINIIANTMALGGTYEVLRDQIFTHPTMSEALNDLFGMVK